MKSKDLDLSFLSNPYYTILNCPNFLDSDFHLSLTMESQKQFEMGKPGQGYVGIVNLQTRNIHLLPAFNKDDGLPRLSQNNLPFEQFVESSAKLGKLAGDLHLNAEKILGLNDKKSHLLGFGIWKAGYSVKFVNELPKTYGRVPFEFYFIKNNGDFELFFVGEDRKEVLCLIPELKVFFETSLSYFVPDNRWIEKDKMAIETIIRNTFRSMADFNESRAFRDLNQETVQIEASFDFMDTDSQKIKYAKNRSTRQNALSIKYEKEFSLWFLARNRGHTKHSNDLIRELPCEVYMKIVETIASTLGSSLEDPIYNNDMDGIGGHFILECFWRKNTAQALLEFGLVSCNHALIQEALARGAGISKVMPILDELSLAELCDTLVDYALDVQRTTIIHMLVRYAKMNIIDTFTLLAHLKEKIADNSFPNYQGILASSVTMLEAHRDQYFNLETYPSERKELLPETELSLSLTTKNEVCFFLLELIKDNQIDKFIAFMRTRPYEVDQEIFFHLRNNNDVWFALIDCAFRQLQSLPSVAVSKLCNLFKDFLKDNEPDTELLIRIINILGLTLGLFFKKGTMIKANFEIESFDFHLIQTDEEYYLQEAERQSSTDDPTSIECVHLMREIVQYRVSQRPPCAFFPTLKEERQAERPVKGGPSSEDNTRAEDFHCHYPM